MPRILSPDEWTGIRSSVKFLDPKEVEFERLRDQANELNKGTLWDAMAVSPGAMLEPDAVPQTLEEAKARAKETKAWGGDTTGGLLGVAQNALAGLQESGAGVVGAVDLMLSGNTDRAKLRDVGKQMRELATSELPGDQPLTRGVAENIGTMAATYPVTAPLGMAAGGAAKALGAGTRSANAIGSTVGLLPVAGVHGSNQYFSALNQAEAAGLDPEAAQGHAAMSTVAEVAPMMLMQATGMGGVERLLTPGMRGAAATAARNMKEAVRSGLMGIAGNLAQELPEEEITTVSQAVVDWMTGVDPEALSPARLGTATAQTLAQTFLTTALFGAPAAVDTGRAALKLGDKQTSGLKAAGRMAATGPLTMNENWDGSVTTGGRMDREGNVTFDEGEITRDEQGRIQLTPEQAQKMAQARIGQIDGLLQENPEGTPEWAALTTERDSLNTLVQKWDNAKSVDALRGLYPQFDSLYSMTESAPAPAPAVAKVPEKGTPAAEVPKKQGGQLEPAQVRDLAAAVAGRLSGIENRTPAQQAELDRLTGIIDTWDDATSPEQVLAGRESGGFTVNRAEAAPAARSEEQSASEGNQPTAPENATPAPTGEAEISSPPEPAADTAAPPAVRQAPAPVEQPATPDVAPATPDVVDTSPTDRTGLTPEPTAGAAVEQPTGQVSDGPDTSPPGSVIEEGQESLFSSEEAGAAIETDPHRVQEIRNSIAEGEMILKSGRTVTGRKMSAAQIESVRRSIENAKAKIGEGSWRSGNQAGEQGNLFSSDVGGGRQGRPGNYVEARSDIAGDDLVTQPYRRAGLENDIKRAVNRMIPGGRVERVGDTSFRVRTRRGELRLEVAGIPVPEGGNALESFAQSVAAEIQKQNPDTTVTAADLVRRHQAARAAGKRSVLEQWTPNGSFRFTGDGVNVDSEGLIRLVNGRPVAHEILHGVMQMTLTEGERTALLADPEFWDGGRFSEDKVIRAIERDAAAEIAEGAEVGAGRRALRNMVGRAGEMYRRITGRTTGEDLRRSMRRGDTWNRRGDAVQGPVKGDPAQWGIDQEATPDAAPAREPVARVDGAETEVLTTGDPVAARYALMELGDLTASHDFKSGAPVDNTRAGRYPAGLQPRDYSQGTAEHEKIVRFAGEKKAPLFVNTAPSADGGPPTVSPDGTVINGNGRVMTLQYGLQGEGNLDWYRNHLRANAGTFGLTAKQVDGMQNPVLVRVADMDPASREAVTFARQGNVSTTQAQNSVQTAASLNRMIDNDFMAVMALDEDSTFSEAVTGPAGRDFRRSVRDALPPAMVPQYFTEEGSLTEAGKDLVRHMLLTKVFDAKLIERLGAEHKGLKRSLEAAIPKLIQFRRDMADQDITPQIEEALEFIARNPEVRTPRDVDIVLEQGDIIEQESISPAGRMMLDFLLRAGNRSRAFGEKLGQVLGEIQFGQGLFAEQSGPLHETVAELLGVEAREGAVFGREDALAASYSVERREDIEAEVDQKFPGMPPDARRKIVDGTYKAHLEEERYLSAVRRAGEIMGYEYRPELEKFAIKSIDSMYDALAARGKPELTDILRATLVPKQGIPTKADVRKVRRAMREMGYRTIMDKKKNKLDVDNLFLDPKPGYKHVAIKFQNKKGVISELLLIQPAMLREKMGLGHKIYDVTRLIEDSVLSEVDNLVLRRQVEALKGPLLELSDYRNHQAYLEDNPAMDSSKSSPSMMAPTAAAALRPLDMASSDMPSDLDLTASSFHEVANKLRMATSAKPSTVVGKLAEALDSLGSAFMAETSKETIPQDPADGNSYSVERTDREYLDAVGRGDMDTAQRLVDEAAKRAGYTVGPVWHGTNSPDPIDIFRRDRGIYFSEDREYASSYGKVVKPYYLKIKNIFDGNANPELFPALEQYFETGVADEALDSAYDGGVNDLAGGNEYIVADPNQIKSADPVVYDDAGNVIPLSHRFNETSDDIRYSTERDVQYNEQMTKKQTQLEQEMADLNRWWAASEADTLNATLETGKATFLDAFGEDWAEFSEDERVEIIREHYDEAYEHIRKQEAEIADDLEYERQRALRDKVVSEVSGLARAAGLEIIDEKGYPDSSRYITVGRGDDQFTVRIADHDAPEGGGFSIEKQERHGSADADIRIDRDGEYDMEDAERQIRALIDDVSYSTVPDDDVVARALEFLLSGLDIAPNESLAQPATTEGGQRIVNAVDAARTEAGVPEARPWADLPEIPREQIIPRVLDAARTGDQLTDAETRSALRAVDEMTAEAARTGDRSTMEQAVRLANAYRRTGTEQARGLAARRVQQWKDMTPEERTRSALADAIHTPGRAAQQVLTRIEGAIKEAREQGQTGTAEELEARHDRMVQKLAEQAGAVVEALNTEGLGDTLQGTADTRKAAKALRKIQEKKASVWDALHELRLAAMLSGPHTHVVNNLSNAVFLAWETTVQRGAEAVVNLVARDADSATLGEFRYLWGGILPGISMGLRNAVQAFDTEQGVFEGMRKQNAGKLDVRTGAIPGLPGRLVRLPLRGLLAEDEVWKGIAARMEVGAQAYRIAKGEGLRGKALQVRITEMVTDMESPAWDAAVEFAKHTTFQSDLGPMGKKLMEVRDTAPGGRAVLPFVKTPANLAKEGFRKSPLGILRLVQRWARDPVFTKRDAVKGVAEQLVGWGMLGMLAALWDDDEPWITGTAPWTATKRGERDLAYREAPPQSIRIGDRWYSYARLDPFATAMAVTVDGIIAARTQPDPLTALQKTTQHLGAQVSDKTFLQGLSDVMQAIESGDPSRILTGYATSFVPGIAKHGLRAADPGRRETAALSWGEKAAAQAWPSSSVAPAKVDLYGDDVTKDGSFFTRLLNPLPTQSAVRPNATAQRVDQAILRYNREHPDATYAPQAPEVGDLSPEEYEKFSRRVGREALAQIAELERRGKINLKRLTPEHVDLIRGVFRNTRTNARKEK